jgi:Ni2+-binding GTPase involved in maturation of urease and hydrogenase
MHKVLSAEDYALILGMPGAGNTTVIAALIRELVRRGQNCAVELVHALGSGYDLVLVSQKVNAKRRPW